MLISRLFRLCRAIHSCSYVYILYITSFYNKVMIFILSQNKNMCLIQDKDFYFTRHAEDRMMVIYNKS